MNKKPERHIYTVVSKTKSTEGSAIGLKNHSDSHLLIFVEDVDDQPPLGAKVMFVLSTVRTAAKTGRAQKK